MKVISSFCADKPQCCVEVEVDSGAYLPVIVTDSKQDDLAGQQPRVRFTREEWDAFVAGVKNGEFDYERLAAAPGGRFIGTPAVRAFTDD